MCIVSCADLENFNYVYCWKYISKYLNVSFEIIVLLEYNLTYME